MSQRTTIGPQAVAKSSQTRSTQPRGLAPDRLADLHTAANLNPALQRLQNLQPEPDAPTDQDGQTAAGLQTTNPSLNRLAGLQRAANARPATRQLRPLGNGTSPRPTPPGAQATAPGRPEPMQQTGQETSGDARETEPQSLTARTGPIQMLPMMRPNATVSPSIAQMPRASSDLRRTPSLRNSTILQRAPAPTGGVQSPALIGAPNTPVTSPDLSRFGVSATTMSNADYAAWKGTIQCKTTMHGASSHGNKTVVTRYNNPSQVIQGWFLSKNTKGLLLYLEGGLTLLAGLTALGVAILVGPAGFPGVFAGLMSVGVGISKIYRGYLVRSGDPALDPNLTAQQNQAIAAQTKADRRTRMDQLRGFEALMGTLGALALAFDPKATATAVSLIVFGIAKAIRSIATYLAKDDPEGTSSTASKVAAAAHVVESAALFFAGGFTLDAGISGGAELALNGAPKIGAGAAFLAVGASKAVRATDQAGDAIRNPSAAGGQGAANVQNGAPPPPPPGGQQAMAPPAQQGQNQGGAVNQQPQPQQPVNQPGQQPVAAAQQPANQANAQPAPQQPVAQQPVAPANVPAENELMKAWLSGMFNTYPNLQQFHLDTITDADIGEFTLTGAIPRWEPDLGPEVPGDNTTALQMTIRSMLDVYPQGEQYMNDLTNDQVGEFIGTGQIAAWEAMGQ